MTDHAAGYSRAEAILEPFNSRLLAGKRILVTGGGSGLGKAIAERAAGLGAAVVICGRGTDKLEAAADEIFATTGSKVKPVTCDIRDVDQITQLFDEAMADGPVDVVVNSAAGAIMARSETLSPRAFDSVLATTLNGTAHVTLEAGRRWIEVGQPGTILSIIASGVELGRPFLVPLTVAKGGVLTLTRSLAQEWGPKGIRVLAIGPGNFPTPGAARRLGSGRDPAETTPLRRTGDHRELADLAMFMMSDSAGYITGEMITIDGGKGLTGAGLDHLFEWSDEHWSTLRRR